MATSYSAAGSPLAAAARKLLLKVAGSLSAPIAGDAGFALGCTVADAGAARATGAAGAWGVATGAAGFAGVAIVVASTAGSTADCRPGVAGTGGGGAAGSAAGGITTGSAAVVEGLAG